MNATANQDLGLLQERIGYRFKNPGLLDIALTHGSTGQALNNDRLEFVGDAVLGCVIAQWLYQLQPNAQPGRMSMLRSRLVRTTALAEIAREILLGRFIVLGRPLDAMPANGQDSILADTFEALLGAVYADGGFQWAQSVIEHLFDDSLQAAVGLPNAKLKGPKSMLQEYMQNRSIALPQYAIKMITMADDSEAAFQATCALCEPALSVIGYGANGRQAEQAAAFSALQILGVK